MAEENVGAGGRRWKLGDLAKAQREAKKAAQQWTAANPKLAGGAVAFQNGLRHLLV